MWVLRTSPQACRAKALGPQNKQKMLLWASCQALFSFLNPLNSFNGHPLGLAGSLLGIERRGDEDSLCHQGQPCRGRAEEPRELTGLREKGRLGRRAEAPQAASRRAFWRRWHLKPAVMGLPLLLLCFWTLEPSL